MSTGVSPVRPIMWVKSGPQTYVSADEAFTITYVRNDNAAAPWETRDHRVSGSAPVGYAVSRHRTLEEAKAWAASVDATPGIRRVQTRYLEPGMRVRLPGRRIRTVGSIHDSGYLNRHNEPIAIVYYLAPERADWGEGNSSNLSGAWDALVDYTVTLRDDHPAGSGEVITRDFVHLADACKYARDTQPWTLTYVEVTRIIGWDPDSGEAVLERFDPLANRAKQHDGLQIGDMRTAETVHVTCVGEWKRDTSMYGTDLGRDIAPVLDGTTVIGYLWRLDSDGSYRAVAGGAGPYGWEVVCNPDAPPVTPDGIYRPHEYARAQRFDSEVLAMLALASYRRSKARADVPQTDPAATEQ